MLASVKLMNHQAAMTLPKSCLLHHQGLQMLLKLHQLSSINLSFLIMWQLLNCPIIVLVGPQQNVQ